MKLNLFLIILAFVLPTTAFANGPGAATGDITFGVNNPDCYMFKTNGGAVVYGVPIDPAGKVFLTASQVIRSQGGLCTLSFEETTPYPECSGGGVTSVNRVTCQ